MKHLVLLLNFTPLTFVANLRSCLDVLSTTNITGLYQWRTVSVGYSSRAAQFCKTEDGLTFSQHYYQITAHQIFLSSTIDGSTKTKANESVNVFLMKVIPTTTSQFMKVS
jgi:hypothetical protein